MLERLQQAVAEGFQSLRQAKTVSAADDRGWTILSGLGTARLPGSQRNWEYEAGTLWDNAVIRIALKWREDTFGEPNLVVYRPDGDSEEMLREHPALDLLSHPNPYYDGSTLMAGILLSDPIDGNAYLQRLRSPRGGLIGLSYLPHWCVTVVPGTSWIARYEYRSGLQKVDFAPEDIVHLRDGMDPANPRKGLGRVGAVLREVAGSNELATTIASILHNVGMPGVVISPKPLPDGSVPTMTPEQRAGYLRQYREKFLGDKRGEPWVQTTPVDVTQLGWSPDQMATDKTHRLLVTVLCAAFNLDPMVLHLPGENTTYSNREQAREAAVEEHVIPQWRRLDRQLTSTLMPELARQYPREVRPDDRIGHDFSQVRSLQADEDRLYARLSRAVGGPYLAANEAREKLGKEPWGPEFDKPYPQKAATPGGEGGQKAAPFRGQAGDRYP